MTSPERSANGAAGTGSRWRSIVPATRPARGICLAAARPWGRVGFIGEGGSVAFDVSPVLIHPQLTLVGSWVCSIGQMEDLVGLLVRWRLRPEEMVTDRFEIADAVQAYRTADAADGGKVAFTWE